MLSVKSALRTRRTGSTNQSRTPQDAASSEIQMKLTRKVSPWQRLLLLAVQLMFFAHLVAIALVLREVTR